MNYFWTLLILFEFELILSVKIHLGLSRDITPFLRNRTNALYQAEIR